MNKIRNYWKNKKGITLVWGAFFLVLCLVFLGLAVDISYMYVVKNQLQVAADGAALAGAAKLDGSTSVAQYSVREEAWKFACKNTAGGLTTGTNVNSSSNHVYLANNSSASCDSPPLGSLLNGGNNPAGDIVLGNWDPNRSQSPTDCRFLPASGCPSPSSTAINAVKIVARRTGADAVDDISSGNNPVSVFLGQIFRIIRADWSLMSASASAIATMPVKASEYISVCIEACTGCTYPSGPCPLAPERVLEVADCTPGTGDCLSVFAWTSLTNHITSASDLNPLICTTAPYVDICNNPVYMTGGEVTEALRNLEAQMYDPEFSADTKEIVGNIVQSWTIIVPVTLYCPPRAQGGNIEPKDIFGYARIRIRAICETGGGNPCHQYGGKPCDTQRPCEPPQHTCDSYGNHKIVIDQIQCVSCADYNKSLGLKPVLIK
jgi:hypothetical protein